MTAGNPQMIQSMSLFRCGRWKRERRALELEVKESLDPDNVIGIMLKKKSNSDAVKKFIRHVQSWRECYERIRQNLNH